MEELTLDFVKGAVPKKCRHAVTQEFVDGLNKAMKSSSEGEIFVENFITYSNVINEGKFGLSEYVDAVKFVSLKLLGHTNVSAYKKVFPERWMRLEREGIKAKDDFAQKYNSNLLVTKIYQQTIVPTWVLNAPLHQKALSELGRMIDDPSVRGMTRVKACEAILNYTKQPEVVESKVQISIGQSDTISELREVTAKLANTLKQGLEEGKHSLRSISEQQIVDAEYKEVEAIEA